MTEAQSYLNKEMARELETFEPSGGDSNFGTGKNRIARISPGRQKSL
jgi:hypothetical protein